MEKIKDSLEKYGFNYNKEYIIHLDNICEGIRLTILDKIRYFPYKVWDNFTTTYKWWFQKKVRGYSDPDIWCPDISIHKYSHMIMDNFVKSKRNGYKKISEGELYNPLITTNPDYVEGEEEEMIARWEYIISEITWAFWFATYDNNDYVDDWAWVRYYNGMNWFTRFGMSIWD